MGSSGINININIMQQLKIFITGAAGRVGKELIANIKKTNKNI